MSNNNVKMKSQYESPILVPLGEMAKGSGVCTTGSSVVPVLCTAGAADAGAVGASDCTAGSGATSACTAGNTAQTACTAGPTNIGGTCSAGGQANPTCTGGAAPTSGCVPGATF